MKKKYIFIDLDGTILDHKTHTVPDSTVSAFEIARKNGHEIILTTGRPPGLFYGIDKMLEIDSFIGANGRVGVYKGAVLFEDPIPQDIIEELLKISKIHNVDIAYESMDDFVLETANDTLYQKFCDHFNLKYPICKPGYYRNKAIYQISFFYDKDDFKKFELSIPTLSFEFSCQYGIDVNTRGGLKEVGIKQFMEYLHLTQEDIIVIGDGFNDIGMLQFATNSIAMGNAHKDVQKHANHITNNIDEDGIAKAFMKFKLI